MAFGILMIIAASMMAGAVANTALSYQLLKRANLSMSVQADSYANEIAAYRGLELGATQESEFPMDLVIVSPDDKNYGQRISKLKTVKAVSKAPGGVTQTSRLVATTKNDDVHQNGKVVTSRQLYFSRKMRAAGRESYCGETKDDRGTSYMCLAPAVGQEPELLSFSPRWVAIDSKNRPLISGGRCSYSVGFFASVRRCTPIIVRLTESGELDKTFNENGILKPRIGSKESMGMPSFVIHDDDSITVLLQRWRGARGYDKAPDARLIRYDEAGNQDMSYGVDAAGFTDFKYHVSRSVGPFYRMAKVKKSRFFRGPETAGDGVTIYGLIGYSSAISKRFNPDGTLTYGGASVMGSSQCSGYTIGLFPNDIKMAQGGGYHVAAYASGGYPHLLHISSGSRGSWRGGWTSNVWGCPSIIKISRPAPSAFKSWSDIATLSKRRIWALGQSSGPGGILKNRAPEYLGPYVVKTQSNGMPRLTKKLPYTRTDGNESLGSILADSEEKAIIGGHDGGNPMLIRLQENGDFDPEFGTAGKKIYTGLFSDGTNSLIQGAIDHEGRYVYIGSRKEPSSPFRKYFVIRVKGTNGDRDLTFNYRASP